MSEFFQALLDPHVSFLRTALLAGLMGSVAFGMVGSLVVVRRISYLAGAISHSALGGVGLGIYLRAAHGVGWLAPITGALLAALLSAIVIGVVSLRARQRDDTVIGAIWAVGMAAGLLFFSITPGYADPMSYLFGDVLLLSGGDLWMIALLDLLVVGVLLTFYNKFVAICFDEEFARVRGQRVELLYIGLLCLVALTIVLMVTLVGIVLVIALLTLPAAVAGAFTRRLWSMMLCAVLLCAVFTVVGLAVSFQFDIPSGAAIILVAGAAYLFTAAFAALRSHQAG